MIARGKRGWGGWGGQSRDKRRQTALSDGHRMQHADDVLWSCTLETLTNVTPRNSIKKERPGSEPLPCDEVWPPHPLHLSLPLPGADTALATGPPPDLEELSGDGLAQGHSSMCGGTKDHSPRSLVSRGAESRTQPGTHTSVSLCEPEVGVNKPHKPV